MKYSTTAIHFHMNHKLTVEHFLKHISEKNEGVYLEAHFTQLKYGPIELFLYKTEEPTEYTLLKFESKEFMLGFIHATLQYQDVCAQNLTL